MEITTRAVALRRSDWREADALATLYTERMGRVRIRVIGARHLTSKFAPWLEPGAESEVRLHSRGRSWPILTGIRPLRSFPGLRQAGALARFAAACEVLELVDFLFPAEEAHPEAYHLLTTTLEDLESSAPEEIEVRVLRFMAALLTLLGYGPIPDLAVRDRVRLDEKLAGLRRSLEEALAPHLPRARRAAGWLNRVAA